MLKLNKKGVTLIELIVSFALVATAVIYFYQTLSTVYDLYVTSRKETQEYVDKDYALRIVDALINNNIVIDPVGTCGEYNLECNSIVLTDENLGKYEITMKNGKKVNFYKSSADINEQTPVPSPPTPEENDDIYSLVNTKFDEYLSNNSNSILDIQNVCDSLDNCKSIKFKKYEAAGYINTFEVIYGDNEKKDYTYSRDFLNEFEVVKYLGPTGNLCTSDRCKLRNINVDKTWDIVASNKSPCSTDQGIKLKFKDNRYIDFQNMILKVKLWHNYNGNMSCVFRDQVSEYSTNNHDYNNYNQDGSNVDITTITWSNSKLYGFELAHSPNIKGACVDYYTCFAKIESIEFTR